MTTETKWPFTLKRAWRVINGRTLYVQAVHNDGGDRYSYTGDASKARRLSDYECARFLSYMRQCNDSTARTSA